MTIATQLHWPAAGRHAHRAVVSAEPAENETRQALKLGLRYRYFLQLSDIATVIASAFLGAIVLSHISPMRAGNLGLRDVALGTVAMALALHLHGLYRRPASRLRPSEWWRPAAVARCLPTAALLALALNAFIIGGGRMTLTAAVAM